MISLLDAPGKSGLTFPVPLAAASSLFLADLWSISKVTEDAVSFDFIDGEGVEAGGGPPHIGI